MSTKKNLTQEAAEVCTPDVDTGAKARPQACTGQEAQKTFKDLLEDLRLEQQELH